MIFFMHRMALGVQLRLKSRHVAWDPRAVRGAGQVEHAHFWGLYMIGLVAAYLKRRAAEARPGGVEAAEAVETVDGSRCATAYSTSPTVRGTWSGADGTEAEQVPAMTW